METSCPMGGLIGDYNSGIRKLAEEDAGSLEGQFKQTESIELSQMVADIFKRCAKCGGMVVNLATGEFVCGRDTPEDIIRNNQRILQS